MSETLVQKMFCPMKIYSCYVTINQKIYQAYQDRPVACVTCAELFSETLNPTNLKMSNVKDSNYYIDWLENSIFNEHIKYYEYSDFNNLQRIGDGSFGSVF